MMKNDPSFPQFDFGSGPVYKSTPIDRPHGMSLEDCLTIQRSASLFFEYARDISSVVCFWVFIFVFRLGCGVSSVRPGLVSLIAHPLSGVLSCVIRYELSALGSECRA